jgi:solute carrier family 25 (mitochondrial citrate transporter), member 1
VALFHYIDVIKSRMQGLHASKYKNAFDCGRQIVQQEGFMALYKGVAPRMTRVCAEVAITMSLYGEVVHFLNSVWKTD